MTREQANERARAMLSKRTMAQLLQDWDLTEHMPFRQEVATIRGWLLEEFERRDPEAFDAWLESDDPEASPRYFFNAS